MYILVWNYYFYRPIRLSEIGFCFIITFLSYWGSKVANNLLTLSCQNCQDYFSNTFIDVKLMMEDVCFLRWHECFRYCQTLIYLSFKPITWVASKKRALSLDQWRAMAGGLTSGLVCHAWNLIIKAHIINHKLHWVNFFVYCDKFVLWYAGGGWFGQYKIMQKTRKWLRHRHMGTPLRVLSESYSMNANMTGFKWFSSFCFGQN